MLSAQQKGKEMQRAVKQEVKKPEVKKQEVKKQEVKKPEVKKPEIEIEDENEIEDEDENENDDDDDENENEYGVKLKAVGVEKKEREKNTAIKTITEKIKVGTTELAVTLFKVDGFEQIFSSRKEAVIFWRSSKKSSTPAEKAKIKILSLLAKHFPDCSLPVDFFEIKK